MRLHKISPLMSLLYYTILSEESTYKVRGNSEEVRSKKMKTPSANEDALLMKTLC